MAVESSAVQISINVVDANSGAAIAGVEQNIQKLGAAGTSSGQKMKQGLEQAGVGALSAREKTRLLTEEFGIRIPRAMQSLIAQSATAQKALNAVGSVMIGIGAIQIGGMVFSAMIHGAEKLWNSLTALPKAVQDYQAEVAKTKDQNFGDTHSIETTRARIDEATAAAERYEQQIRTIEQKGPQSWSWRAIVPFVGSQWQAGHEKGEAAGNQIDAQKKLDQLQHTAEAQQAHEQRLSDIDLKYAGNVGLSGKQKHDAAITEARDRAHEERFYGNEQDRILGNSVPMNAGADKEAREVLIARKKADAELANQEKGHAGDAKSQAQELARIHEQALESGLRGSELYHAQEAAAIEDLKRRGITSAQAIADVHTKFHNEEMNRYAEIDAQITHQREQTELAGLTGSARIKREGEINLSHVYERTDLNSGQRLALVKTTTDQTDQEMRAQNERDSAEKKRNSDELAAKHQHSIDETEQIEAQARVKSLSAEKQKTASIKAELDEKLRRYKEELSGQEDAEEQYHRRAAAAQAEANAEMVAAAKEAHDKMAEQFTHLFKSLDHPKEALKELGDKAAGNMAATIVQHFQTKKGGAGTGADSKGSGGLFGEVFEGFGFGKKKTPGAGTAVKSEIPGVHGIAPMASATFSITSATIHVGSGGFANSSGPGTSMAATSFGGGGYTPGGAGTTFYAPGSTGASGGLGTGTTTSDSNWGTSGHVGSVGATTHEDGHTNEGGFGLGIESPSATASGRIGHGITNIKDLHKIYRQGKQDIAGGTKAKFNFGGSAGTGGDGSQEYGIVSGSKAIYHHFKPVPKTDQEAGYAETQNPDLSGKFDKKGDFTPKGGGNGSMTSSGLTDANTMSAAEGVAGMYSAYESTGGMGGATTGALSGAELGMAVAGPLGAAVGAAAGAVIGYLGPGGAKKAEEYDKKTVRPHIADTQQAYNSGSMDFLSAYSDLQGLDAEAFKTLSKMGPSARRYRNDHITPEIKQAEGKLSAEEKAGRSQYSASAAQYATGTSYVPETGYNLNHAGERIFSSVDNSEITKAVTEGNRGTMPAQTPSMGDVHLHVHAIDAKGVAGFLDKYKHNIRSAVNDSYAENSGGGL